MYEPTNTDLRAPELRIPPEQESAFYCDQHDAGGDKNGPSENQADTRGYGGGRPNEAVPNVVEAATVEKMRIAYYALVTAHAVLLLDVYTEEAIRVELAEEYQFKVSRECIEDLKHELNSERRERKRLAGRFRAAV